MWRPIWTPRCRQTMNEWRHAVGHQRLDPLRPPIFLDQLGALAALVEALKRKDPVGFGRKNAAKRLKAIQSHLY